jgi:glutamate-1-semialdehyde 2,1-aminomutase
MEPVLANSGCVPPTSGYLESVQQACRDTGTVLIFDEVVTGFRVSIGGAQQRYGVTPDMATFSKAIAGGLPLSVVAGRRELLDQSIPRGEVFFAGTFNGSPLSLVGARHILARLGDSQIYDDLSAMRSRLTGAIQEHSNALGLRVAVQGTGSMPSIAFDCDSFPSVVAAGANKERYTRLASYLAERERILLPPLYTETIFLSTAHLAHERDLLGGANARFGLVGKRCRFLKREAARVYPSRRKCRLSPFARGARKSRRRRQSNAAKEQ